MTFISSMDRSMYITLSLRLRLYVYSNFALLILRAINEAWRVCLWRMAGSQLPSCCCILGVRLYTTRIL